METIEILYQTGRRHVSDGSTLQIYLAGVVTSRLGLSNVTGSWDPRYDKWEVRKYVLVSCSCGM
jgi:hypothetical protein